MFERISMAPPDAIFGLIEDFRNDPNPEKINLSAGVYADEHGRTPVLGFRLGDVAYATDCNQIPDESWPLLEGLDTLVLDALWDEPHPTHFSVAEAVEVIQRVRPRRAFLTHVSHRLDYEQTNARLPDHVKLSHDGLRIGF